MGNLKLNLKTLTFLKMIILKLLVKLMKNLIIKPIKLLNIQKKKIIIQAALEKVPLIWILILTLLTLVNFFIIIIDSATFKVFKALTGSVKSLNQEIWNLDSNLTKQNKFMKEIILSLMRKEIAEFNYMKNDDGEEENKNGSSENFEEESENYMEEIEED